VLLTFTTEDRMSLSCSVRRTLRLASMGASGLSAESDEGRGTVTVRKYKEALCMASVLDTHSDWAPLPARSVATRALRCCSNSPVPMGTMAAVGGRVPTKVLRFCAKFATFFGRDALTSP
jgi:hypothetical protein